RGPCRHPQYRCRAPAGAVAAARRVSTEQRRRRCCDPWRGAAGSRRRRAGGDLRERRGLPGREDAMSTTPEPAGRKTALPAGSGSEGSDRPRRQIAPIPAGAVPVMEAIGISKGFGATTALVDVSLKAYSGRILALLGDNGAGKSTLIKILSGVFPPDRGELRFNGEPVRFSNPGQARSRGIATVFQDLAVCELLSVTRNVVLGREPLKGPGPFKWLDLRRADE